MSTSQTSPSPPSPTLRFGLSRRALLLIAGGFGLGLLLFFVLWLDMRDNGNFYRAQGKADAVDGQVFEPLPVPMAPGERSASGLSEAAEEAARRPKPVPPPAQVAGAADSQTPIATPPPRSASDVPSGAPMPISRVQPDYPSDAMRRNESGTVVVRIAVGSNGKPDDVEVLRSSRSRALDRAATQAARRWRFQPGQAGTVEVPFEFKLDGR
ncbi:MAG: TonB family protein [Lysobacter sp.]|nr:TonB family protein [Lysobacter sp.]